MIEYQLISKERPDIKYAISDVSNIFINNCKEKFPEVETYRMPVEQLNELNKEFDCVYQCAVFEHSLNVRAAIRNCINLGKIFHFVFFRWRWKGGGLKPRLFESKNFYSSTYNIWQILKEIEKYGQIDYTNVINNKGDIYSLEEYRKISKRIKQRDGSWLAIHGRRK
jgi:hypothetical protein